MHPEPSLASQGIDVPYVKRMRVGEHAAGYVLPLKQDVNPSLKMPAVVFPMVIQTGNRTKGRIYFSFPVFFSSSSF